MSIPNDRFRGRRSALAGLLAAACLSLPAVAVGQDAYDPAVTYKAGTLVIGSDGNMYRAGADVKGSDPATSSHESWRVAHVASDLVLDVPGRFKTIADAWKILEGCRISEKAKVVILVAPGRHELAATLVLDHSEGARIVVHGAGVEANPTVLACGDADGVLLVGSRVTLENLVFVAKNGNKGRALRLEQGSRVVMTGCRVSGFQSGVLVEAGSHLTAKNCSFITTGSLDCVTVKNNSNGIFISCTAKSTGRDRTHHGFMAYNGGSLYCDGCEAEGWYSGFCAHTSSSMHLDKCVGRNNGHGASTWHSSSMNVIDCTFANNAESGIAAFHSTAQIDGSRLNDNPTGVIVFGPALAGFDGKPTTIAGGRTGIWIKGGGRVWLREKPQYQRVEKETDVMPDDEAVIVPQR